MNEIPLEAPPEDVIEQRSEVLATDDADLVGPPPGLASTSGTALWDADPADLAEQLAEVPLDDDWA